MQNRGFAVAVALAIAIACLCAPVRPAHALATLEVNVAGQSLGEVTLQITDEQGTVVKEDKKSRRAAGFWIFDGVRPGKYRVEVRRKGALVGTPSVIEVEDNKTNTFRANAQSGAVTTVSSAFTPSINNRFSATAFVGWTGTPWDAVVTSQALASQDSGSLHDSVPFLGLEGRYNLSPTQQRMQALGAGLFITGTFMHYLGGGLDSYFGDRHPPTGQDDIGAGMNERWSLMLGFGKRFNPWQKVGLALMIGAHMTQADVGLLVNESGGGGADEQMRITKYLFGPFVGAEVALPLAYLQTLPLQLVLQTRLLWMPDVSFSRASSTGRDYHLALSGGLQYLMLLGLRVPF